MMIINGDLEKPKGLSDTINEEFQVISRAVLGVVVSDVIQSMAMMIDIGAKIEIPIERAIEILKEIIAFKMRFKASEIPKGVYCKLLDMFEYAINDSSVYSEKTIIDQYSELQQTFYLFQTACELLKRIVSD